MEENVKIAISTKEDGNMSVNWGEERDVWANRERFLEKNGISRSECVWTSLLGGGDVRMVGRNEVGTMVEADGFITDSPNIALFMVTGDCLPTVIYAPDKRLVGLAHLGFRGVDKKLVMKMVYKMRESGADSAAMEVFIGPGVRKETYIKYGKKWHEFWEIVDTDNHSEWQKFVVKYPEDKYGLDLVSFVKQQLYEVGVMEKKITVSPIDTIADKSYFSHYRSGLTGEREGRFATVVKLMAS